MKGRSHGIFEPLALLASVGLLGSTLAGAQASDQGETPELVQIVVTGTLLPTTPDKVAVPIVTLDAKTLEQSRARRELLLCSSAPPWRLCTEV